MPLKTGIPVLQGGEDVKAQTKNYHVEVFPHYNHGYFEHFRHGDEYGGGLWFEGKNLIDYDGTFELPKEVIEALRKLGFFVAKEFE